MERSEWERYIKIIRDKKKPRSQKDKKWIKSLGPYCEIPEVLGLVRISNSETRKDARERFGELFAAKFSEPDVSNEGQFWTIMVEPYIEKYIRTKSPEEIKHFWIMKESKEEALKVMDDLFSGTRDLEELGWQTT